MALDNDCREIIQCDGLFWFLDAKQVNKESLTLREVLGGRDEGIQPLHCFQVDDNLSASEATHVSFEGLDLANPERGLFTIGFYVNLPVGSDDGNVHPLVTKGETVGYSIHEKDGDLFFNLADGISGPVEVSTVGSGINFADGETHLVFVDRDTRLTVPQMTLDVFEEFEKSIDTTNSFISNDNNLYLGASGPDVGAVTTAFVGTKISGFMYFRGKVLTLDEKFNYWKNGILPTNAVLYAQLDEAFGEIVYDSSGLKNHGTIRNFTVDSRSEILNGFSFQNAFGYSTGQFVEDRGGEVFGSPNLIDPQSLIPFDNGNPTKDIFGNDLEFSGRVRYNIKVVDIVCWKGNGSSSANVQNPDKLEYVPGSEEFSVFWVAEEIEIEGGVLIAAGTAPDFNYRYDYNPSQNKITWNVGGVSGEVAVAEGMRKVVVNVGLTEQEIFVDGVSLGTFPIGSSVTPGFGVTLFGLFDLSGNQEVLTGGSVVLIGTRGDKLSSSERIAFFADEMEIPDFVDGLWVPSSQGTTIFDVSKNNQHADVVNFLVNVWTGEQSVIPYLANGFSQIHQSLELSSDFIIVPYDVDGNKIPHNEFGFGQVVVEHVTKDGHNIYDCYIDMNPNNVNVGFVTTFWNKLSFDIWTGLDSEFIRSNPFLWHISELNQDYFKLALDEEFFNFAFAGRAVDSNGFPVEIFDFLMVNLGNNIQVRPVPVETEFI